jgi:hypothetical protein
VVLKTPHADNLSTLMPMACQVGYTVVLPQKDEEEGGFMKFQEQNELTIHSNNW